MKAMLMYKPVLCAPNFQKPFKLAVDASNVGVGNVLLQEDVSRVENPVCYFSKKFENGQKTTAPVKKNCLPWC